MYLPLLSILARLAGAGRTGEGLAGEALGAVVRILGTLALGCAVLLIAVTGVVGGVGVAGACAFLRRFGERVGAVAGDGGSDSSVTDPCEDRGERARSLEASLRGVWSREVSWREVSATGDGTEKTEGDGNGDLAGGKRVVSGSEGR